MHQTHLKKYSFKKKKYILKNKKSKKAVIRNSKKLFLIIFLSLIYISLLKFSNINNKTNIVNIQSNKTNKTEKVTKVCLCAIAKKENLYIQFFIDHYRKLGYDHIYLYDNNDKNDEKIEDVIKDDINNGYVTLIDYRGYRGPKNSPQMNAYYDCYEKHNLEYDWLSFFDIDEYLILKPKGINIQNFLNSERYKECPNIKINWIIYSDNNQIKYENKPLTERFTNLSKSRNSRKTIKSIMRGNISYYNLEKTYNPHYLYLNVKSCSSSGKFIGGTCYYEPPDYSYAQLNHYIKTMPEFIEKMKKGLATSELILDRYTLKEYFDIFFRACDKTDEKVKIFNEAFNTNFN